jgi:HEAT repeat protein
MKKTILSAVPFIVLFFSAAVLAGEESPPPPPGPGLSGAVLSQVVDALKKISAAETFDLTEAVETLTYITANPVPYLAHVYRTTSDVSLPSFIADIMFSPELAERAGPEIVQLLRETADDKKVALLTHDGLVLSKDELQEIVVPAMYDEFARVRSAATDLALKYRDKIPRLSSSIGEVFENPSVPDSTKNELLVVLGGIGDAEALKAVVKAASLENSSVCVNAIKAMREFKFDDARTALEEMLAKNANPVFRGASASAIGRLGYKESVPALIDALMDADNNVVVKAIIALKRITGKDLGDDPKLWIYWWREEADAYLQAAESADASRKPSDFSLGPPKPRDAAQPAAQPVEIPQRKILGLAPAVWVGVALALIALFLGYRLLAPRAPAAAKAKRAQKPDEYTITNEEDPHPKMSGKHDVHPDI